MPASFQIVLEQAQRAALDRYIAERGGSLNPEEALAELVAQALAGRGLAAGDAADEGLKPEDLNASNDS